MKTQVSLIVLLLCFKLGVGQLQFTKQWDARFGGANYEKLMAFAKTKDDGFIVGGWCASGLDGDKTEPNWDPDTGQHTTMIIGL